MNIEVRKFEELEVIELYNILKLRTEVFVVEQECAYQDLDGRDEKGKHFFIKDGERLIAYTRLLIVDGKLSMGRVVVDKEYRGRGLAKKLVKETIAYGFENYPYKTIYIEAQSYLVKFYSSLGFERISEDFLLDDILHCKMKLERDRFFRS